MIQRPLRVRRFSVLLGGLPSKLVVLGQPVKTSNLVWFAATFRVSPWCCILDEPLGKLLLELQPISVQNLALLLLGTLVAAFYCWWLNVCILCRLLAPSGCCLSQKFPVLYHSLLPSYFQGFIFILIVPWGKTKTNYEAEDNFERVPLVLPTKNLKRHRWLQAILTNYLFGK